jgi:hypothetical protein
VLSRHAAAATLDDVVAAVRAAGARVADQTPGLKVRQQDRPDWHMKTPDPAERAG